MIWYAWALIALLVFAALAPVAMIGKPRGTWTPGLALWAIVINAVEILIIVLLATN